jgi:two-component sensor histidine kinase
MSDATRTQVARQARDALHPVVEIGFSRIAAARRAASSDVGLVVWPQRWHADTTPDMAPGQLGRMVEMVATSRQLSQPRSRLLSRLLEAAQAEPDNEHQALRPLWMNEIMHRAYQMVRLARWLDLELPLGAQDRIARDLEQRTAEGLTATLLAVRDARDGARQPSSDLLRDVVRNLADLCFPITGNIGLVTSISRVELAPFRRRALVLMAWHLVFDALDHGMQHRCRGRIEVALDRSSAGRVHFKVGYEYPALLPDPESASTDIIDDLASLLESDGTYRKITRGRMTSEIEFPLR